MATYTLDGLGDAETILTADVCVIGAGLAGLAAALHLAEKRAGRVVVIESGLKTPNPETETLNDFENPIGLLRHGSDGRCRGLGGTSRLWGGKLLPLAESDLLARDYLNLPAWPLGYDALESYTPWIEKLFRLDRNGYEEDVTSLWDGKGIFPRSDQDFVLRFGKWPTFRDCNLANLVGARLETCENPEIWLGATTVGYEFDPGSRCVTQVIAKSLAGRVLRVAAKEFLVAAGTLESTRQLLLLQRQSEERAFPECEVLGRYLNDHLGVKVADVVPLDPVRTTEIFGYRFIGSTRRSFHLELNGSSQRESGIGSAFAFVTMAPSWNSPLMILKRVFRGLQQGSGSISASDLAALIGKPGEIVRGAYWRFVRKQLYWPGDLALQMNVWIEQIPTFGNRITLGESVDALGVPKMRIEWIPSDLEEETFRGTVMKLVEYWRRHSFSRFAELKLIRELEDRSRPICSMADDRNHPAGTLRMGLDPKQSVVAPDLSVHGVRNLSVASAAVFPSSGSANPTLAILQLALHASENIARRVRESS